MRVLFVEDNEADAELALRRLRMDGLECSGQRVETEESLVGALRAQPWDLILSDFSLPSFDGLSALAIAVRESPQVPFIFVSGTIGEERAIEALRCGAVDYVLKSNLKRLAPAVRRALREAGERVARDEAEARLRDVIDVARDWIWELDSKGEFVFSSESVRDVLGVEPARILGTHYAQWLHESDRERMDVALSGLDRDSRTLGSLTVRWRHVDGSTRWLERHALALVDGSGGVTGFRGADRDVTEREAQQLRIMRLTRILEMLSGINTAVVRIRDRMELLQEACRIAVTTGQYQTAVVSILDPGTRTARPCAWAGSAPSINRDLVFTVGRTAREDTSVTGRVLRSGEIFLCNDATQLDPQVASWPTLRNASFGALVALPLKVDGTPVGVLLLAAPDSEAVTNDELRLLGEVAANLSFALQYFEKETAVQFLSYFDPLTGLAKRVLLCERLAARMAGLRPEESQPAVAVLDIEHLSILNDSYGRHAGDHLLQMVGDRLKGMFADTERLAYLGAGCFALVLEDAADQESALKELQQYTFALFQQPFRIGGHDIPVTVKSGLACRDCGVDAQTLVQNAEVGLRQAKAAGEQYHHHRLELSSLLSARLSLEHRLRGALENQQYALHYQPKLDIASGRVEGVEALLRWNDPERGIISPAEFLSILESTGMIVAVGEWAVQQAAADCRRWRAAALRPVHVAVNCSPLQLRKRGFVEQVLAALDGWAHDGWGLDLEITESLLIDPDSSEVHKLRALRAAGARVAIDDFGTGYSSLSRLSDLPVDTLKIDRSFIKGLPQDRASARLVPTIIGLARAFDLVTVAEGVETEAQLKFLKAAGCHQSQGYLHARPMPAADLEALLARPTPGLEETARQESETLDAVLSRHHP
ncbi:MAG TPA: EAL domain-containing protein [Steroidobacteraceae bacterium]|nr:EAL domain-containing protein [Steroidobacteraceae bacterium]